MPALPGSLPYPRAALFILSGRRDRHEGSSKIDRIYKIYRIRRKKINPVNLVNPVYFHRFMASLIASERLRSDFWFKDERNGTLSV
jgi:hypothetical protein